MEAVSFFSSAYIPQCLRYGGRPTLSNAHRAHESSVSADNIRDELDEVPIRTYLLAILPRFIFVAHWLLQLVATYSP